MSAQAPKALTREDLLKIGPRLYGARSWQTRLAHAIGLVPSAVSHYASGRRPIPRIVAIAVRKLYAEHRAQRTKARVLGER